MNSPLNYLGGKSRLARKIVSMLPEHTCYCEPFSGAAWVLFAKPESKCEVINDLDGELVNFWRVIQNHLEPFLDYYKYAIVSRKMWNWENGKDPDTLTDLQRAVRYYYLQKLGFGGKTDKRTFGTSATGPSGLNLTMIEERLLKVHWRLERVMIENLDALTCILKYDRPATCFYLDPPYYGVSQGYAHKFTDQQYRDLAEVLSAIQGNWVLSLNDHPFVRDVFAGHKFTTVDLRYSVGNSRTVETTRADVRKEVLIQPRR